MNGNTGHGHVWTRPDGRVARCGGPGLCKECSRDMAMKLKQELNMKTTLVDAAENVVIAYAMKWNMDGVIEVLIKEIDKARTADKKNPGAE